MTRTNEELLGIDPPCVYTYLGHTIEQFGDGAISLSLDALDGAGRVSPFDTGGLVKHLTPVSAWTDEQRRQFLGFYTWPADELRTLIGLYPSAAPALVEAYLRGEPPTHTGPHEVFPGDSEEERRVAAIWEEARGAADGRAWFWEGRTSEGLPVETHLIKWSCGSASYQELLKYQETVTDVVEAEWLAELNRRYVQGGATQLVASLLNFQREAA